MESTASRSISRTILGLIVLILGIGFLLNAADVWEFNAIIGDWWPTIIILIGLASFMNSSKDKTWPIILVTAGTLLLLRELELIEFDVWQVIWPAILIIIGLSILFSRVIGGKAVESSEKRLDLFTAFAGLDKKVKVEDFEGGKLTAVFGGIKLDLREADLPDTATLDIFVAFGGIELIVPKTWKVHATGMPILGGWEDKTIKPDKPKGSILHVKGTCIFGGVEIKN